MPKIPNWSRKQELERESSKKVLRIWEHDETGEMVEIVGNLKHIDKYRKTINPPYQIRKRFEGTVLAVQDSFSDAKKAAHEILRSHPEGGI